MKSPGHREHPEHKVKESRVGRRLWVQVDGELLADSDDVIQVEEDGNPVRYYFPRADTTMARLVPSETTSRCPYKGVAHYFTVESRTRMHPRCRLVLRRAVRRALRFEGTHRLL